MNVKEASQSLQHYIKEKKKKLGEKSPHVTDDIINLLQTEGVNYSTSAVPFSGPEKEHSGISLAMPLVL